jgi:hypothetical protein
MTSKFIVTVQQAIITEITVEAATLKDARKQVEAYGPAEAAKDMASEDISAFVKIKSVRAA